MKLLVLALLILYDSMLIFQLEHVKALDTMAPYAWESGDFRAMRLGRDAAKRPFLDYEELAMAMLTENFDLTGKKLSGEPLFFPVRRQKEFERLSDAYRMVFAGVEAGGYSPCRRASGLYGGFRLRRAWDHRPVSSPPPPGDLHPDGAS